MGELFLSCYVTSIPDAKEKVKKNTHQFHSFAIIRDVPLRSDQRRFLCCLLQAMERTRSPTHTYEDVVSHGYVCWYRSQRFRIAVFSDGRVRKDCGGTPVGREYRPDR